MNISGKVLWAALAAALLSVDAGAKVLEDAVATVNGSPVLLSEYQREVNRTLELWDRNQPGALVGPEKLRILRERTLEELIDQELLFQQGAKNKELKVRERDIDQAITEVKSRFTVDETGRPIPEPEVDEFFKKQLKFEGVTFAQYRERLSRQIMIRKVVDSEVKAKVTQPEEGEVRQYFEKVKAFILSGSTQPPKGMEEEAAMVFLEVANDVKLMSSERARVSKIVVRFSETASPQEKKRAKAAALEIKKRIDEGKATFADIARTESEDPESAPRGGDVGFAYRGRTPPEIEKVIFAMSVGEVSQPIEAPGGYHIVRVVEKRAAEPPEFANFKEELGRFLTTVHFSEELAKYVKGLKAKAVIERKLPPN
ncbi:MAG: peptidylprolyl isomerase [Elusimicrobia bacterium]|nr:peptidylprolyl isomerase [Elusimicrobiota bacterium]